MIQIQRREMDCKNSERQIEQTKADIEAQQKEFEQHKQTMVNISQKLRVTESEVMKQKQQTNIRKLQKSVNDNNIDEESSDSDEQENDAYNSRKGKVPGSPIGGRTTRASDISANEGRNNELFKSDYSSGLAPAFGSSLADTVKASTKSRQTEASENYSENQDGDDDGYRSTTIGLPAKKKRIAADNGPQQEGCCTKCTIF